MSDFLTQFGIDWKLFLSQLINFALLLIILRLFVYKPLVELMKKRKEKIEQGLVKAEEAEKRLQEVDQISKSKIKEAEQKGMALLQETKENKKKMESDMMAEVKKREGELLKKTDEMAQTWRKQAEEQVKKEAAGLVRTAIAKAVDSEPSQIDELLVKKAVSFLGKNNEL